MTPELFADVLLALLLTAALAAIVRLEFRLRTLRAGQSDMARTAIELNAAAQRAEAAIRGLRQTADGAGADLDTRISRARALADELGMLSERAGTRATTAPAHRAADAAPVLRALAGAR
jgi:hypothetical protein